MNRIVVLAGGSGERFWPLSTKERPKQFLYLTDPSRNLLQQTIDRASLALKHGDIRVATNVALKESTLAALPELNHNQFYFEPEKRNTAAGIFWSLAHLLAEEDFDESGCVAILPADASIAPAQVFAETVHEALQLANQSGDTVTLGVPPTRAETGYGYIQKGPGHSVKRFTEKPSVETAEEFLKSGDYLWNAGMFFFRVDAFLDEVKAIAPDLYTSWEILRRAVVANTKSEEAFRAFPKLSIDYAVMERTQRIQVIPAPFLWDDLGAWDALRRALPLDGHGNVVRDPEALIVESHNSVVFNETDWKLDIIGIEDMIVVVREGRILVCPIHRAQDVKHLAAKRAST